MAILYAAGTVLVNPPGALPVLTLEQLWAALELKRRYVIDLVTSLLLWWCSGSDLLGLTSWSEPQLFLDVIDTCEVLEDDGGTVLREVKFKDGKGVGMGPVIGPKVQERITHINPISAGAGSGLETFTSIGSASRVLNIISSGLDEELYLTFTFEWDHPEIEDGSEAALQKQKAYQAAAPKGVSGALGKIREMVKEGRFN